MATKLFKPGEYAYHGHCRITTKGDEIVVSWMDWGKTEVKKQKIFNAKTCGNDLPEYLTKQSTPFWADTMMGWIKVQTSWKQPSFFSSGW